MTEARPRLWHTITRKSIQRLDILGAFLNLSASILLVFALEEGGSRFPWDDAPIIATFVLSGVLLTAFVGWETIIGRLTQNVQEPIFPLRLVRDRIFVGLLLYVYLWVRYFAYSKNDGAYSNLFSDRYSFLTGFPFIAVIINLPQKFQAVNGSSPSAAGLSLLALLLCTPVASTLAGFLVTKRQIPPFYLLLGGAILSLIGIGLTSALPNSEAGIPHAQYGYEIIMGFGFGTGVSTQLIMIPLVVKKQDTRKCLF